jgi:radical SAM protein with 4Fe4S-binding SPASM domain
MNPYSRLRDPASRLPLAELLPLPHPWAVYLEPTNVCNFKCKFCPESFADYEQQVGGFRNMDAGLYDKVVSDLVSLGKLKVLRFYMLGEPLLNKQLGAMIRKAVDAGVAERTEVTTNATALTEQRAHELVDSGLDYLRVSIYGVTDKQNLEVTGSKVPVAKILENVRTFRRVRDERGTDKPFLNVKMIDSFNSETNQSFLDMYRPVADEAVIEKPMNWNEFGNRDLIAGVYGTSMQSSHELFPYRKDACPFPFFNMVINADGDVTVCGVDWNKSTKTGNVRDQSLADIWFGPALREFRRMHLEGRRHENEACRNCTYLYTLPDNLDGLSPARREQILKPT